MVYCVNESESDFEKIKLKELNASQELKSSLIEARVYALKGIIDGMNYCIQDALKYSKASGADISDELKEIKELALENHKEIRSVSDLVSWLENESINIKPVFLSNILGYAKSFADIFGWDIQEKLKEYGYKPESKKALPLKNVKKSCGMIRIAGYADL